MHGSLGQGNARLGYEGGGSQREWMRYVVYRNGQMGQTTTQRCGSIAVAFSPMCDRLVASSLGKRKRSTQPFSSGRWKRSRPCPTWHPADRPTPRHITFPHIPHSHYHSFSHVSSLRHGSVAHRLADHQGVTSLSIISAHHESCFPS
ncbi:hypothetical protein K431DRAFT_5897 [Polychaeton citri CBS 116435]|uniref:Uncharacterized protein n=1 Tax=Polychaeton citri CBS 116435 TaxID=1314669 RepID=A0A9P4QFF4_9PEZI|nr:hypothetical protein K431DRAFT_5897 [Polychaeton citri CBS 116435]